MNNILASYAQFENDVRSERTIAGMEEAIRQGRWCWPAPIGLKHSRDIFNRPILEHSDEAKFIKRAFELAETGIHEQIEIVDFLKDEGFARATKQQINKILNNPLYAGIIRVDWIPEDIVAKHRPIIPLETFIKVQDILSGKRPKIVPKLRNNPNFPLRNFVICSKCGQKITGSWSTGRTKKKYPYYHCRTKGCSMNVRKDVLDKEFYASLRSIQPNDGILDLFSHIVKDVWSKEQEQRRFENVQFKKQITALEAKKSAIIDLFIEKSIDEESYKQKLKEIRNQINRKRLALNENEIELKDIDICLEYCRYFLQDISNLWETSDFSLKQRLQTFIFPKGVYFDGKSIGNIETALIFKQLGPFASNESSLVALRGFEPRSDG